MILMISKQFPMSHQKGKMTLMTGKQSPMLPQKGKVKMKLTKKYTTNQTLKLQLRLKNKLLREKKIIKSELEQDKVDIQVSRESDIIKVQDVFDRAKKEEPLNVENFFIDGNDIFDSEDIYNADREFIIDLIIKTNFIADAKKFVEESNESKMEIVYPEEKKIEEKEQMSIDDDKKRENASVENNLMKKVKTGFPANPQNKIP